MPEVLSVPDVAITSLVRLPGKLSTESVSALVDPEAASGCRRWKCSGQCRIFVLLAAPRSGRRTTRTAQSQGCSYWSSAPDESHTKSQRIWMASESNWLGIMHRQEGTGTTQTAGSAASKVIRI